MKKFPVLEHGVTKELFPRYVPWEWLEKYREIIEIRHMQAMERLAERGGLSVEEIYAHVFDLPFSHGESFRHCAEKLLYLLYYNSYLCIKEEEA